VLSPDEAAVPGIVTGTGILQVFPDAVTVTLIIDFLSSE